MAQVSVKGGSSHVLICGVVELLVGDILHEPSNKVNPHPGAGCVEALNGVVAVQGVEEQETGLGIV